MTVSTLDLRALDLVGPHEIGARMGVRSNTVSQWATRHADFPAAELTVSKVPLWRWEAVRTWGLGHGKAPEVSSGELTAAELADAVDVLDVVRDQVAREVRESADAVSYLLAEHLRRPARARQRVGGRFVSNDGHAGAEAEWDTYWQLSAAERDRLRPWLSDDPCALSPDVYAACVGFEDVEAALEAWRGATALADAARLLEAGKLPVFEFHAITTYDPGAIFGDDGAVELARAWARERS